MAQVQGINTVRRQLHVRDNPGYVIADGFAATTFDAPPDIEAAWEREIARRRQHGQDDRRRRGHPQGVGKIRMKPFVFHPEAEAEYYAQQDYYESQQVGFRT